MNARREARTKLVELGIKLRKKLRVGIATPFCVPHRLVACGANACDELVRMFRACERGGNVVGQFDPRMRGPENFRRGAQAMENLAEKPFAGIDAAAFGEILRTDFSGERGNFCGFGHAGVVFPQPRHRRRIFGEPLVKRQRLAFGVHRQRRAAGRVHADADNLIGAESFHGFLRRGKRLPDGDLRAFDIIGGMLAREIRIAAQNDTLRAVLVIPDRGADFTTMGGVHHQGADRIGSVIKTDGVFCAHGDILIFRCFFAMPGPHSRLTGQTPNPLFSA